MIVSPVLIKLLFVATEYPCIPSESIPVLLTYKLGGLIILLLSNLGKYFFYSFVASENSPELTFK
jgi:hypothetical protein